MDRHRRRSVQVVLILMHAINYAADACPSMCICKWRNGKQTVECSYKNLVAIPEGMDVGTQVLEFNGNKLGALHTEKFLHMDLINLQRIYLARCGLVTIDDRSFKGLTNLVELDLSGNLLGRVPSAVFVDCPSLMKLTLNSNPIKTIRRAAFSHLSFLNTLELSGCRIVSIEDAAFQGLHSLEWLRLDTNQLTALNANKVMPDNLRGVELQGNPWQCDCRLRALHYWLESFSVPQSVEPVCMGPPKFGRRTLRSIPGEQLACLPDVEPSATFYLEIAEGKNISLSCHVTAVPEAHVSWSFQGQQLHNDSLASPDGYRLLYFVEEGTENKYSELYIYNTNVEDNGTFVCSAENAAGIVQTNFTIRVIVQREPIVVVVSIPFDYLLAAVVGLGVVALVLFCAIIISIAKCGRRRRRLEQKRQKTKEVALNSAKCGVELASDYDDTNPPEQHLQQRHQHIVQQQNKIFYSAEDLLRAMSASPTEPPNQVRSPTAPLDRRYQLEQNPDLINDTTAERREADGEEISITGCGGGVTATHQQQSAAAGATMLSYSKNTGGKLYHISAVDVDGYPVDYGLPKLTAAKTENFYRTLPHKRPANRQANARRFSRDVEFLCPEHYCPDVRYTADGYPERAKEPLSLTLLPDTYKIGELPWVLHHYPAHLHMIGRNHHTPPNYANKRCVGTDTREADRAAAEDTTSPSQQQPKQTVDISTTTTTADDEAANEIPTESPDEGYEGESVVL